MSDAYTIPRVQRPFEGPTIQRPYDGRSAYPLDDEAIAAINQAIEHRHNEDRIRAEASFERNKQLAQAFDAVLSSKLSVSEAERGQIHTILTQMVEAREPTKPLLDTTKLAQYKKYPYLSIAGSCVDRFPVYDWGVTNFAGAGSLIGDFTAPGIFSDGNLRGNCYFNAAALAPASWARRTAACGFAFNTERHCGQLTVKADCYGSGFKAWVSIFGWIWITIRERLMVFDSIQGNWVIDSSFFAVKDNFGPLAIGSDEFIIGNQLQGFADVHPNRWYWVDAQHELEVSTIGNAEGGLKDVWSIFPKFEMCIG
jgi:hypothetical protein